MADLQHFTNVFVNPKLRKMRFEAYGIITSFVNCPKLRNAVLKYAWKQPPVRGWCPLPPKIGFRFDASAKYQMVGLMGEVEESLRYFHKCTSVVTEEFPKEGWKTPITSKKQQTSFVSETDIAIAGKIIAAPKKRRKDI